MAPVPMKYFEKCQSTFKPPLIANENAYLGDISSRSVMNILHESFSSPFNHYVHLFSNSFLTPSSEDDNPEKPIACGLYRLEKGTPLVYTYTYDEMKIIVEGSFDIEDETGQKVHAVPGDVFHFPKGSKITFTTENYGLAFFTGQRKKGGA